MERASKRDQVIINAFSQWRQTVERANQPRYKQSTAWRRKASAPKRSESSMHDLRLPRMAAHQEWSCCLSLIGPMPRTSSATAKVQRCCTWRSCSRPGMSIWHRRHDRPVLRFANASPEGGISHERPKTRASHEGCSGAGIRGNGVPAPFASKEFWAVLKQLLF